MWEEMKLWLDSPTGWIETPEIVFNEMSACNLINDQYPQYEIEEINYTTWSDTSEVTMDVKVKWRKFTIPELGNAVNLEMLCV